MKKIVIGALALMFVCFAVWALGPHCYNTCRGYALQRNEVFRTLAKTVSEQKNKSPAAPVVVERSVVPQALMDQNYVQYWGVTASGTVFMANRQDMLLVAEPKTENGVTTWTCNFYPEPVAVPLCSTLKY